MKKKVYVVPHSHWDREWYFSIEDSNTLLCENLDFLMEYLENNPEFPTYSFDGQYSLAEEFNKYVPEKNDKLKELISNNRIHIGPWYTQCDTLLIQTESIIRNLLLGQRGAESYGKSMSVGYLPDIFGQNAYLPAIFNGFELKSSILQRGVYNDQLAEDLTFDWVAPNGDSILTNNLFYGYGPGKFLSTDESYVQETLLPILDRLSEKTNPENPLLLPAGGDQVLVRTHFPEVVADLNKMDLPYEFILSDYESFMSAVKNASNNKVEGELIASQKSRIHSTIRSQRVDIKLLNSRVEENIYQQLEPLGVLHQTLGGRYPQAWINTALKLLFDAHAHDSIGGCNSDETNRNIINRLLKAERIADDYITILKKQIARAINPEENGLVVFNLLPKEVTKTINVVVFTRFQNVVLKKITGDQLPQTIINQTYLSGGKQIKVTAEGEQEIELPGYYRSELAIEVEFSGFGYQQFFVTESLAVDLLSVSETEEIENKFYKIHLIDGKIQLQRKSDGQIKSNWIKFENTIDGGDSYDYSPVMNALPMYNDSFCLLGIETSTELSRMTLTTSIKVAASLEYFQELTDDLVIETTIDLQRNSDTILIKHHILNEVKDHRVRVLFEGENADGFSYGDQGFSLQKRSIVNPHLKTWREEGFAEAPQPIFPLERLAAVNEKDGNVMLLTKGLKEYEATKSFFALTLYRSVGLLGRDDLSWRPGRASGINNKIVETPEAQMLGELNFAYGYRWKEAKLDVLDVYRAFELFTDSQLSYQIQDLNSFEERIDRFELPQPSGFCNLPATKNLLTVQKDVFVSAFKRAEDSQKVILRVFNPQEKLVKIDESLENVQLVTLAEKVVNRTFKELRAKDFASVIVDPLIKERNKDD
ncbi:glycoside hydrolase family 38 C-terminal domain-containing protein [Enterococcus sp. CWB-B31]|uniref:glycoside hydrolase family 38 N-terminal domain-containing protein n=1 Tax=Enterococcus sp. CWB-B31 TaxID=2885159 RepID=UPI001E6159DA|nr:glycoside hydrolase family 38 C-terminal domain-containing protein [Enterococcus sp. CWB-B31]MCB5955992.1 alpha-mannosidase [Enterococcus sp. CWB-B31]